MRVLPKNFADVQRHIDLNCDLGEGFENDAALMPLITSANIACGAHAGDTATMRETVPLAQLHGVVIGAHPGFADRGYFGRRELKLSHDEIVDLVQTQVRTLQYIAATTGLSRIARGTLLKSPETNEMRNSTVMYVFTVD